MVLGAGAASASSLISWATGEQEYYFEAPATIVTFLLIGGFLEEWARVSALSAINRLREFSARQSIVIGDDDQEDQLDVASLTAWSLRWVMELMLL